MKNLGVYIKTVFVFLLITLSAISLGFTRIDWQEWRPAPCMPGNCFCEQVRPETIGQPVNAFSNLSFVLVGLLILGGAGEVMVYRAHRKKSPQALPAPNAMLSSPLYSQVYGTSIVVIGLGSLFYHASLTFVGEWFDMMGMYMLASFVLLYNLARLLGTSGKKFAGFYLAVNALLGVQLFVYNPASRAIFMALMIASIGLELFVLFVHRPKINKAYLGIAVGLFVMACTIWVLDNSRVLCIPQSWLQGHALWHLLSAAATGVLYLYYRSEKKIED